jgi:hypothetical protein
VAQEKESRKVNVVLLRQGLDGRWDQESYTFFAVHDKTIVSERCHFSSEEPLILIRRKIIRSGAAILSSMRP